MIAFSSGVGTAHCWAAPLIEDLETNSQTELNRTRRIHLRSHDAEIRSAHLLAWGTETYVIEYIEELRRKLQIHTLCDVVAF